MLKKVIFPILAFLGIFVLAGCNLSLAADVTPPPGAQAPLVEASPQPETALVGLYPLVPPDPTAGKDIFSEKCAPCHGSTGLGDGDRASGLPNPVAPIGTAALARNSTPSQWYTIVSQGNLERFMPPFPSLNDRQRWDVIAYAYSLSQPADSVDQGKTLYQANCASCHGETGKGDGPQASGMNLPDFTNQEYMAGLSAANMFQVISEGNASGMPAFADQLSEDQRWALTDYLRTFTFAVPGQLAAGTPAPAGTQAAEVLSTPAATSEITSTLSAGVISGVVTNGSGGELPAGMEIMLHGFDDMQMVMTKTVSLSPDNTYKFDNVEMPEGRMFFSSVQYSGATYGSDISTVQTGQTSVDLPITVYETTTDASTVKVDRMHLFFEKLDDQTMRVAELLVMSNNSNKTIIPQDPTQPTITFKLPQGYQDLQFQDGDLGGRYVATADGFGDTAMIYPGQGNYQILLAYTLPYDKKLDLVQPINQPIDAVVVLVPQDNFKVKGNNLQDAGTRDVQGVPYQMYNLAGLKSGDSLNLTVTTSGSTLLSTNRNGLIFGLAAVGLALVLGGGLMYWRQRRRDQEEDAAYPEGAVATVSPGANAETPEELMDAILALDDLYTSGQIEESAYIQRRSELKDQLKTALDKS